MILEAKDFDFEDGLVVSIEEIKEYLDNLKSEKYTFSSDRLKTQICEMGVTRAEILLNKNFLKKKVKKEDEENADGNNYITYYYPMSGKEMLLSALCGYQLYISKQHETYTERGVNFKTKAFATSGNGERNKEYMRIIWWLDSQIKEIVTKIHKAQLGNTGYVTEMRTLLNDKEQI